MENRINFYFVRSLKEIALIETTVSLWNENDIRNHLTNRFIPMFDVAFREVEFKVQKKVENLEVSQSIKEDLLQLVGPIGVELSNWIQNHSAESFPGAVCFPRKIFWTSYGTIDQTETARILIDDEKVNIVARYKLACSYFFATDIPTLWDKIPVSSRNFNLDYNHSLINFWASRMAGSPANQCFLGEEVSESESLYTCALDAGLRAHNKPAIEFALQALSEETKTTILVTTATEVVNRHWISGDQQLKTIELLCFLFSQMDIEEQDKVFKTCAVKIIDCFTCWLYEDFCLDLLHQVWDYVSENNYVELLEKIAIKIRFGLKNFNYSKFFLRVWQISNSQYKEYAVSKGFYLFRELLNHNDLKYMELIFDNVSIEGKKKFIFSSGGLYLCQDLYDYRQLDHLSFLLRKCLRNPKEAVQFRRSFDAHRNRFDNDFLDDGDWSILRRPLQTQVNRVSNCKFINEDWHSFISFLDIFISEFKNKTDSSV